MAVTRDSLGLTEGERRPAGSRRADFPVGSYVRTRHPLIDNNLDGAFFPRPVDFGQVRPNHDEDEFVTVRWSQADDGCSSVKENPAVLVATTEAEYLAFVAGTTAGYQAGYNDGAEDAAVMDDDPPSTEE